MMSDKGMQTDIPPVTPLAMRSHRISLIFGFDFDRPRRMLGPD